MRRLGSNLVWTFLTKILPMCTTNCDWEMFEGFHTFIELFHELEGSKTLVLGKHIYGVISFGWIATTRDCQALLLKKFDWI